MPQLKATQKLWQTQYAAYMHPAILREQLRRVRSGSADLQMKFVTCGKPAGWGGGTPGALAGPAAGAGPDAALVPGGAEPGAVLVFSRIQSGRSDRVAGD